ncbi:hypothetical protein Cgig2_023237 [Carnegiea gigantea]|uniref:Uncharacterized protein n=1 Tax=Carnegiea gigantea TaxID=171969 RepID=A0A9Q1GUB5_9CARY|nr:hypothetical protein Cgig2_023237 [Carnegiea gigantea]
MFVGVDEENLIGIAWDANPVASGPTPATVTAASLGRTSGVGRVSPRLSRWFCQLAGCPISSKHKALKDSRKRNKTKMKLSLDNSPATHLNNGECSLVVFKDMAISMNIDEVVIVKPRSKMFKSKSSLAASNGDKRKCKLVQGKNDANGINAEVQGCIGQ